MGHKNVAEREIAESEAKEKENALKAARKEPQTSNKYGLDSVMPHSLTDGVNNP